MSLKEHAENVEKCFLEINSKISNVKFVAGNSKLARRQKLIIVKHFANEFNLNYLLIKQIYNGST